MDNVSMEAFGFRSILTHVIMAVGFVGTVVSGLFVSGEVGLVLFIGFLSFTSGMWISQSIHSLGNAKSEDSEYQGVLYTVIKYVRE